MNAAACGEQSPCRVVVPVQKFMARSRGVIEGGRFKAAVARLVMPSLELCQKSRPMDFGFTDKGHIRVVLCFIGHQGYVRAAQCDGSSALPETVCDRIGVRRAGRVKGNCNEVRMYIEVDRRHGFVHVEYSPMGRHKGGQIRHCHLLKV
jgi:hypothetical protein